MLVGHCLVLILAVLGTFYHVLGEGEGSIHEETPTNSSIITFHIEHALDPLRQHFTPRTRIQLMIKPDGRQGLKYLDRNLISGEDIQKLKELIANNDLYTIRVRVEKPDWKGHFVTTSLPVCELQKVGFKEDIGVFLSDLGNIVGLDYRVPKMTITKECDATKIKDVQIFQTRISISEELQTQPLAIQITGPRPPYLQNVKVVTEGADGAQQQKPNQSFLSKYWYIVVGLVMYMLTGGTEPPKDPKDPKNQSESKQEDQTQQSKSNAPKPQVPSSSSAASRAKKE